VQGKIAYLDSKKFGFIEAENEKDYFFHQSALQDVDFSELTEGLEIEFMAFDNDAKGPRAEHITIKGE